MTNYDPFRIYAARIIEGKVKRSQYSRTALCVFERVTVHYCIRESLVRSTALVHEIGDRVKVKCHIQLFEN